LYFSYDWCCWRNVLGLEVSEIFILNVKNSVYQYIIFSIGTRGIYVFNYIKRFIKV
jgi:hypothetical protein